MTPVFKSSPSRRAKETIRYFKSISLTAFCALLASTGSLIAADMLNLYDVYTLALVHDPTYASAQYQFAAAREKIPQAQAKLLPHADASINPMRQSGINQESLSDPTKVGSTQSQWSVQASQTLFDVASWYSLKSAKAGVASERASLNVATQAMMIRVTEAYFELLDAEETTKLIEVQIKAYQQLAAQMKESFQRGVVTITEYYEAQARLEVARSKRLLALGDVQTKRNKLETLTGPLLGKPIAPVRETISIPKPQPANIETWATRARNLSPGVLVQVAKLSEAEFTLAANKANHLPKLQLTTNLSKQYSSSTITTPGSSAYNLKTVTVGLQLNFPLMNGGETASSIREATALRSKTDADLAEARLAAETNARQYYIQITTALEQIKALQFAVVSSEKSLEGNAAGLKLGTKVTYDVLNAREALFQARLDLIQTKHKALVQLLKLKSTLGDLSASDFKSFDVFLQSKSDASQVRRKSMASY